MYRIDDHLSHYALYGAPLRYKDDVSLARVDAHEVLQAPPGVIFHDIDENFPDCIGVWVRVDDVLVCVYNTWGVAAHSLNTMEHGIPGLIVAGFVPGTPAFAIAVELSQSG